MMDETFKANISKAREQISQLPEEKRGPLLAVLDETIQRHEELRENFARIHDAVGEWQLMVKYLIFDREATIRERDELRRMLGNQDSQ